eukprot:snap_masked-scaffold_15-processed-gene-8.49-mRNA-1 protein AED:1.00 eAED:1.00 QI:0/-1/0/0/-1/1/1/0/400
MPSSWDKSHEQVDEGERFTLEDLQASFEDGGDRDIPIHVIVHKAPEKSFKPRRGNPEVTLEQFDKCLILDSENKNVYYHNPQGLNEWKGMFLARLVSIKTELKNGKTLWEAGNEESELFDLSTVMSTEEKVVVTVYLPSYCSKGYSAGNEGYVFYYNQKHQKTSHGRKVLDLFASREISNPRVRAVHHFGHRYFKKVETAQDKRTYHSGICVEFEDNTCTIVELAWRHGIGGYNGKSTWVLDSDAMFQSLPREMVLPWKNTKMEIRITDLPENVQNKKGFQKFLKDFENQRFIDPSIRESFVPNRASVTKRSIFEFVLNRASQRSQYSVPSKKISRPSFVGRAISLFGTKNQDLDEGGYNCQTFSASFTGFLSGEKKVRAYSVPIVVPSGRQRWFTEGRS